MNPTIQLSRIASRIFRPASLLGAALGVSAVSASAQVTFSIDHQGATRSIFDSHTARQITSGDVLTPNLPFPAMGPLAPPGMPYSGLDIGLVQYPGCVGTAAPAPTVCEVDAISYGNDLLAGNLPLPAGMVWFSVDRGSNGWPGAPVAPNVTTETPAGDGIADIFLNLNLGVPMPMGPGATPTENVATIDGDGLALNTPWAYPGFGVTETGAFPDNVDAFDTETGHGAFPATGIFFSLSSGFHTGSAPAHNVSGGDVLHTQVLGGFPGVYAAAVDIGLDSFGYDTDDLDAVMVVDNGIPGYQPWNTLYDWLTGASDLVLFSVRQGSAIVGQNDSLLGLQIAPGDILIGPAGGIGNPGIMIACENLGLCTPLRGGPCGVNDDLDALDMTFQPQGLIEASYCFCPTPPAPLVADPLAGCANSTGVGGRLNAVGSSSVTGNLDIVASQLPPNQFGIVYMGPNTINVVFGDGLRCVGAGGVGTFRFPVRNGGATGTFTEPGIVGYANTNFPAAGHIVAGSTWRMQGWYRDPAAWASPVPFNLTNAVSVTFRP